MIAHGAVQWLNPIDCTMRCADVAVRQLGYPGIETQLLVWLGGRLDPEVLRRAIARLSRSYPVIASRLVGPVGEDGSRFYWQFRRGEICPLREASLMSDAPEAVLDRAAEILSSGSDPATADPLEFHLLHRPGGKDVLVIQYNHVLMDNPVALSLLKQLDRLSQSDEALAVPSRRHSLIFEHLHRFPRETRREAIQTAIRLQGYALRGRAATLLPAGPGPAGQASLRMATRTLGREAAGDFRRRIVDQCGFPCLSMAVLGSAFRAIHFLGPPGDPRQDFVAGIGIPLDRSGQESLIFENLTSAVPIRIRRERLLERDQVARELCDQLREQLVTGVDLGALGTTAIFSRRLRYIEWVIWHLVRYGYSLWYAYFGSLDAAGRRFCGVPIEDLCHTGGPIWSMIGLTLLVNQYDGRLHFQATYDPRLLAPSVADALLDFVLADITSIGTSAGPARRSRNPRA